MKCGIKLTAIETLDYSDLKEICDAIEKLGFIIKLVDNGNVICMKNE